MLELHENGKPVYINPYHVVIVRPHNGHTMLTVTAGSVPHLIVVDEHPEEVAASVWELLSPQEEHIEVVGTDIDTETLVRNLKNMHQEQDGEENA